MVEHEAAGFLQFGLTDRQQSGKLGVDILRTMIQLSPVGFALSTDLYYEDIARLNCRARFRAHGRGLW